MDVKIIKLLSGQEIIAKIVSEEPLVVASPLTIHPQQNGQSLSLGLAPFSWAGLSDQVTLNPNHITAILDAEPELSSQYLSNLSGIVLAPAGAVPTPSGKPKLTLVD